jgi:ketosteroid isomerase-like protein
MKRNETRLSILSALLLVTGSITLAVTGLEGAENVYEYGLGVQKLPNMSAHEHSGNENTSVQKHATHESEEGTHDNTQQFANEPQIVAKDDGHAHAHSEGPSTPAYDNSNDKLNHPASLIAAQLADAIATGDINSLRSVVAPDVLIFESGGVESSLDEYEGHHMPADMAFMKAMQREVISRQVLDSGESATVVTRSRIHGMYKDQNVDRKSTETLVMRNEGGLWKVIHIHWSSS